MARFLKSERWGTESCVRLWDKCEQDCCCISCPERAPPQNNGLRRAARHADALSIYQYQATLEQGYSEPSLPRNIDPSRIHRALQ